MLYSASISLHLKNEIKIFPSTEDREKHEKGGPALNDRF